MKKRLITFMKWKAIAISNATGLKPSEYFNKTDIKEIEEWDYWSVTNVYERISCSIITGDTTMCPFCVKYDLNCDTCSYVKIHGICSINYNTSYGKIINTANDNFVRGVYSIMEIIGEEKLLKIKNFLLKGEDNE